MALPISVPYTFANATTTQNLSSLDVDFSTVYNAVNGIGNGTVSLANVSITGGTVSANITSSSISSGTSNVAITSASGPVSINTNGNNAVYIDASQDVGIGTTSPTQKFHVYNAGSVYTQVQSVNASTGAGAIYKNATANWLIGAGPATGGSEFAFVDQTNNSSNPGERMRIDSSGNVQVGGTTVTNTAGYVNSRTNARAWCNFNGTSASPITPRANYNISSVTKNSTGNYTLNFATALADANYSVTASANLATGVSWVSAPYSGGTKSTSAVQIAIVNNGAFADLSDISVTIFGN